MNKQERTKIQAKYIVLAVLCLAHLTAAMAGNNYPPVLPLLMEEWGLTAAAAGMIISASQAGYVAAVIPCGFLSDKFSSRNIYILGAIEASLASIAFAFLAHGFTSAIVLRFLVGLGTGAIYVPGLKLLSKWFPSVERGKAIGIYTSFAVIAQATSLYVMAPITIAVGWERAIFFTSVWGLLSVILMLYFIRDKPVDSAENFQAGIPPQIISPGTAIKKVFTKKPVILINLGYMGHMWEYIAYNAWIGPFMVAVAFYHGFGNNQALVYGNAIAATAILGGALAVGLGGFISDKIGRTRTVMIALLISATCTLSIGWLIHQPVLAVVIVIALLGGFFVIMDSAVFKAGLSEIVEPRYSGSVLGIQSFLGFGTGVISPTVFGWILGVANPATVGGTSHFQVWGWSFGALGVGALVGIVATYALRRCPESALMARGKR